MYIYTSQDHSDHPGINSQPSLKRISHQINIYGIFSVCQSQITCYSLRPLTLYLCIYNAIVLKKVAWLLKHMIQGVRSQTVTSNFDLTERKNAINFNLKVDSDQGRLEIWYSTIKIQKNILQHPQNLCQSQISYFEITIFY